MNRQYDSVIVDVISRVMIPVIQLYGIYVLIHGHYGPGGGFQAGAALAASVLLARVSFGREASARVFPERLGPVLAGLGLLIYILTGFIPMLSGGAFLDYSYLPIPGLSSPALRYEGILSIEVGVTLAVAGVLVMIFDHLTREDQYPDEHAD